MKYDTIECKCMGLRFIIVEHISTPHQEQTPSHSHRSNWLYLSPLSVWDDRRREWLWNNWEINSMSLTKLFNTIKHANSCSFQLWNQIQFNWLLFDQIVLCTNQTKNKSTFGWFLLCGKIRSDFIYICTTHPGSMLACARPMHHCVHANGNDTTHNRINNNT